MVLILRPPEALHPSVQEGSVHPFLRVLWSHRFRLRTPVHLRHLLLPVLRPHFEQQPQCRSKSSPPVPKLPPKHRIRRHILNNMYISGSSNVSSLVVLRCLVHSGPSRFALHYLLAQAGPSLVSARKTNAAFCGACFSSALTTL